MNGIGSGFLAGIVLGFIFSVYVLVRWQTLKGFFSAQDEAIENLGERRLLYVLMHGFGGASLLLGLIAGLVFNWLGAPVFYYLAFGGALLLSALALISRTELAADKIFWNVAVGGILGLLVPLIAS